MFGFLYFWGFPWPWKLTFNEHWVNFFSVFVSLMTYLSYIFYWKPLFSVQLMMRKREQSTRSIFWRILLKFEENILEIHKHICFSITWIMKKLNSIQTLVKDILEIRLSYWSLLRKTYRNAPSITGTLTVLNKFCVSS